jgi:flagellar FliL protein
MAEASENPIVLEEVVAEEPVPKQRGTGKKKATVAVLLFAIGMGVWWAFLRPRATNSTEQASPRTVLPLESFTVNLADPEEGHFLRATLAIGVEGQLPSIGKPEGKTPEIGAVSMATIRDSIISVLTTCKSVDLLTPEGKAKLKADLVSALNRDVPALQAREVYFTEFLVQR